MGFFSKMCDAGMKAGAAVTTVGAAAVETSGHAVACGALTVVGQEEEAKKQKKAMDHSARAVSDGAKAMSLSSEPWLDLNNSHRPPAWLADWMSGVSDGRKVCDLFMVGTHDTVAKMGADFAECQCWSVEKQLMCGVRMFDCRFKWDGDHLRGFHGIIDMHIELKTISWHIENFLAHHPTEAVIIMISTKGCSPGDKKHSRDFVGEIMHQTKDMPGDRPGKPDMWTYWTGAWPTLGRLRGKCFMCLGNGWPPNTDVQDQWKEGNGDKKFGYVMKQARKPHEKGVLNINYTSCTGQDGICMQTPKAIAVKVNRRFHEELEGLWHERKPDISPCVFMMDFPGVETIKLILCRNGPGVVKKAVAEENGGSIEKKFKDWDTNHDGTITEDELTEIFSSLSPDMTADAIKNMLTAADANKDGVINYAEFIAWIMDQEVPQEVTRGIPDFDDEPDEEMDEGAEPQVMERGEGDDAEKEPPPVDEACAAKFLDALWAEYVEGVGGAAGEFFDSIPPEDQEVLCPYEDMVRDEGQQAIIDLRIDWGLKMGCPVNKGVAIRFLQVMRDEYVDGKPGAAGEFFDMLPPEDQDRLCVYEDFVRETGEAAVEKLKSDWGV